MVDDKDNQVDGQGPAWELPLLLLGAFRGLVDDAHDRLARRGHPDARPGHGFALQAVGDGATVSEVGRRLGVSKQAAAKTLAVLADGGYVATLPDPEDRRSRRVVPTDRGRDLLAASATAFAEVVADWGDRIGADRVAALHAALADLGEGAAVRLDLGSWAGQVSPTPASGMIGGRKGGS